MVQIQLNMAIYYGWFFNCFSFFFFLNHWPIVYQVHCFALLIRSVSFFGFWFIFALSLFHSCEFHFTIQPLCTPPQVRPHIHTYKPRTYHYDCCTISLLIRVVWGIKQAHAETKWKTHAFHHRTLPGLWHPDPTQSRLEPCKLNLDTSKYIISRRQVYLWVVVPQTRATGTNNKRVRYAFDQSTAWWLVGCVFTWF